MTPLVGIKTKTVPRAERKHPPPEPNQPRIYRQALRGMFTKLDPRLMIHNPVMFVVEVGCVLTLLMCLSPNFFGPTGASRGYVIAVTLILFITLLFANFAEAYAEGRGKAQAETLRKTRSTTQARRILNNVTEEWVAAGDLRARGHRAGRGGGSHSIRRRGH